MGVVMEDTGPVTVLKALATAEGANPRQTAKGGVLRRSPICPAARPYSDLYSIKPFPLTWP
jgi:hypothetical protein